ncbi:TniQ protein [Burkholderia sp. OK233]|nr:TniQ protein [Burkholderia sp. OK233]
MAIALLPLKEGETLGSNFGRYAEVMGLKSTSRLRRLLFGGESKPRSRFPTAVDYLAMQASDYWNLEAEDIVRKHTEFQYATMMASQSAREKILHTILASHSSGRFPFPFRILGRKDERTATLRYCEGCLAEWIEKQQVPFWRIDDQLTGVYCCVRHSSILKSVKRLPSENYFDQTVLRLSSESDERVLQRVMPSEQRAIEDVAKRSGLQRRDGGTGKSTKIYRDMFKEAGFVRDNCWIKHEAVISAWFDYFGQEYCYLTNMTAGRISKWLDRLSGNAVRSECPHPFMFIAGESFLEHHVELPGTTLPQISCKAQNLVSKREDETPFLELYPCKGALHRSADVLEATSVRRGRWKLVCTCGVSYWVRNSAQCDAAQLVPISYGDRYRKRYLALIAKGENVWSAARKLQLSPATARRWGYRERVSTAKSLPRAEIRNLRATWRRLVKNAAPERRITAAIEADPVVHKALWKHDQDWLCAFNRSHRSPGRTKGAVRLKEPTSDQIREAWRNLIATDPPIMATRRAILEKAGFNRWLGRNRSFEDVLADLIECRQAYLERVIFWLANLASGRRLGDCDEAILKAGLRRGSFTKEQRERIRGIELMNLSKVA